MQNQSPAVTDAPDFPFALLGFFIPIAGVIAFFIERDKRPLRAVSALKGAGYGVGFGVLAFLILALTAASIGNRKVENTFGKPAPSQME